MKIRCAGFALFAVMLAIAGLRTTPAGVALQIRTVAPDLYLIQGPAGSNTSNVTVCVTPEGLVLIDAMYREDYGEIMARLREVSDRPIRFLINTHHHVDHTSGNAMFIARAEILAHENTRANMLAETPDAEGVPSATFSDSMTLHLGDAVVEARHLGRGHTNGDAVIYFPKRKVLVAGDLFNESAPYIDYASGGSSADWIRTLDRILEEFDFEIVITGHGGVKSREDVALHRRRFMILRARMADLISRGVSREEMPGAISTDDLTWRLRPSSLFFKRSLPGLYDEMKAELDG